MNENRVVTQNPRPGVSRALTYVEAGGSMESWISSIRRHMDYVGGQRPEAGCALELETDVNCNGTIVTVYTCCDEYPSTTACVEAHARKVEHACDL